ncbi:MAG: DUF456 domain-containing protein [Anaerolineales bacterium]|nr:DUF456 domain-containing protein [Anaerolineales bacterium]
MTGIVLFGEFALLVVTLLVMAVGLVGAVVPILPGSWLIWLAAIGYGLAQGVLGQPVFDGWIGGVAIVIMTLLAIADLVLEYVVTHSVAHQEGISGWSTAASIVLGLVGLPFFPPFGSLVGAVGGLFVVEYFRKGKDWRKALKGVKGYAKGTGWAIVAEVALCLVMIGVFVGWVVLAFAFPQAL